MRKRRTIYGLTQKDYLNMNVEIPLSLFKDVISPGDHLCVDFEIGPVCQMEKNKKTFKVCETVISQSHFWVEKIFFPNWSEDQLQNELDRIFLGGGWPRPKEMTADFSDSPEMYDSHSTNFYEKAKKFAEVRLIASRKINMKKYKREMKKIRVGIGNLPLRRKKYKPIPNWRSLIVYRK